VVVHTALWLNLITISVTALSALLQQHEGTYPQLEDGIVWFVT
jgi:hypothetical protein